MSVSCAADTTRAYLVQDSDATCNSAPIGTATYTTTGNQLTLTFTCPAAGTQAYSYTATPTSFS